MSAKRNSENEEYLNGQKSASADDKRDIEKIKRGHVTKHPFETIMEYYRSGDPKKVKLAKEWAVEEMDDTVKSIFHRRFHSYCGVMDDMYQEGRMAVIVGMSTFDEKRSSALNYFYPRIQHAMMLYVDKHHGYTQYQGEMITLIKRAEAELNMINGKDAQNDRTIANYTGIPLSTVIDMRNLANANMGNYLDLDNNLDSDTTDGSYGEDPADSIIRKEEVAALEAAISMLTDTEQFVVKHMDGVYGYEKMSQMQIAKKLGMTSERVGRIHNDAIYKLSHNRSLVTSYGHKKKKNYKVANSITYFRVVIGNHNNIYADDDN